jgi:hypothetical protein
MCQLGWPRATTHLLTIASVGIFCFALVSKLKEALQYGRESYQLTEWLINYSAGFIRRGWPGELIAFLSAGTGAQANYVVVLLSSLLFLALLLLSILRAKGRVPLVLILSPILMGMPLYGDFLVRKDVLGILFLALCLALRRHVMWLPGRLALLNLVACLAILSHETFFFYAVPALVVLIARDLGGGPKRLLVAALLMTPAALAFGLCVLFKGDSNIMRVIHESWNGLWLNINPMDCCLHEPGGSIEGLQWSSARALALPYSVLFTFSSIIYVPLAWCLTIAACFFFLTALVEPREPGDRGRWAGILIFQLVAIAPLFVVGWDFGRWLFFWTCGSLLLHLDGACLSTRIAVTLDAKMGWLSSMSLLRNKAIVYMLCLVFSVPGCCWTIGRYFDAMPVGFFMQSIGHFSIGSLLRETY